MDRGKGRVWFRAAWPLVCLCLLTSSRWLIEGLQPQAQSTALSQALGCFIAAGLMAGWALLRIRGTQDRAAAGPVSWGICLAGAAVVSGPAVVSTVSRHHVSGENATLALSLTPVVVAVASSAFGQGMSEDPIARLWPGLAGLAGLLLLLPQPAVLNWRLDLALVAMPLVAGLSAAFVNARLVLFGFKTGSRSQKVRWNSVALGLASLAFAALAAHGYAQGVRFQVSPLATGLDGVASLLTLTVLGELGAFRWSAQFLIVPLLTLLQGAVLLRPVLDTRSWSAFLLLAASSGYLLWTGSTGATKVETAL